MHAPHVGRKELSTGISRVNIFLSGKRLVTIIVRAGKVFPVRQLKVSSSSPDFQTNVQQVGDGEFKIDIEPKQTTHAMVATLTIRPDNLSKTFYANARVTNVPITQ
jgi:hypothetical protein